MISVAPSQQSVTKTEVDGNLVSHLRLCVVTPRHVLCLVQAKNSPEIVLFHWHSQKQWNPFNGLNHEEIIRH